MRTLTQRREGSCRDESVRVKEQGKQVHSLYFQHEVGHMLSCKWLGRWWYLEQGMSGRGSGCKAQS